jgi:hypothetical protein
MRAWIANHLRELADRLDSRGATRVTGWSFTFEEGEGIRFRQDGRGCPVAYVGEEQYDRAHSESDEMAALKVELSTELKAPAVGGAR